MIGKYPRTEVIREERRKRAEAVQAESVGRTPREQLARLDSLNLVAAKERVKLIRKIKQEEETTKKQPKKSAK